MRLAVFFLIKRAKCTNGVASLHFLSKGLVTWASGGYKHQYCWGSSPVSMAPMHALHDACNSQRPMFGECH